MVDIAFFDKIGLIFNLLKENVLFALILLLITIIVMDLLYGRNNRNTRKLYIIIICLLFIFIIFNYSKPFINIMDVYVANIFRITYFPSIIEYVTMILITILIQFISCVKKKKIIRQINIWVGLLIEVLFIINLIAMNNITVDLNSLTSIYENDILLSIFQISSIIFMLWVIFNLIVFIISLFLSENLELPKLKKDYY